MNPILRCRFFHLDLSAAESNWYHPVPLHQFNKVESTDDLSMNITDCSWCISDIRCIYAGIVRSISSIKFNYWEPHLMMLTDAKPRSSKGQ